MLSNEACEQLDCLQSYLIEMRKFRKQFDELAAPLDRWIAFMNYANALDREALPAAFRTDANIVRAAHELIVMGLDPIERDIYDAEVLANMVDTGQLQ